MDLTALANKYGTDKGTTFGCRNAYTTVYEFLMNPLAEKAINILEIGLNIGGPEMGFDKDRKVAGAPSLQMWSDYFPNAQIHGIDISDFSEIQAERFTFHRADCGDEQALEKVASTCGAFDIVVDDGSHASYHQQLSLLKLFPSVKRGGYYVIEDLGWQPHVYEASLPSVPKTAKLLHGFQRSGTFRNTGAISADKWTSVVESTQGILFFDQRTLSILGRAYNQTHGVGCLYERSLDRRPLFSRPHASGIVAKLLETARALVGDFTPIQPPHTKLAILQKG